MTRLNYSNLPPEAQQAIQKLTGCTHEELEGKTLRQTDAHTIKIGKAKLQSLKSMLYKLAQAITCCLIALALLALTLWLMSC